MEAATPGKLLGISGSYWEACALHAGVKLDLFTKIAKGERTAGDVAGEQGYDLRGVTALLNALVSMGLLIKKEDHYSNAPEAKSFLIKDSPKYLGHMIMHHHHLVESWAQLDRAVRSGKPIEKKSAPEEKIRENFLMGMYNMAMAIAPGLSDQIDLGGRHHLLDLGGGPATYAIHFCLKNPHLKATVYDFPTTEPFARKTIEQFGLSERIDFMAGDYLADEIKGSYDVAWLSHILHSEGPSGCETMIEKTAASLEEGGLLLIHEFILENTLDAPLFPALFSLNMLVNTKEGRSYSEDQIKGMLAKAGLKNIQRLPFEGPNESGIITGTC
jgi:hypothetical protein